MRYAEFLDRHPNHVRVAGNYGGCSAYLTWTRDGSVWAADAHQITPRFATIEEARAYASDPDALLPWTQMAQAAVDSWDCAMWRFHVTRAAADALADGASILIAIEPETGLVADYAVGQAVSSEDLGVCPGGHLLLTPDDIEVTEADGRLYCHPGEVPGWCPRCDRLRMESAMGDPCYDC